MGAPNAREQAGPTHHWLFERDPGIGIEVEGPIPVIPLTLEQCAKTDAPAIPRPKLIPQIAINTDPQHAPLILDDSLSLPVELLGPS